jgi:hypothetical protein
VWAVDALLLSQMVHEGQKFIPDVEEFLKHKLISYGKFLYELGVPTPYKWVAGMEDLKNRCPYAPIGSVAWLFRRQNLCLRDVLITDGLYSPGDPPEDSLAPFFTELFDACGEEWPGFKTRH